MSIVMARAATSVGRHAARDSAIAASPGRTHQRPPHPGGELQPCAADRRDDGRELRRRRSNVTRARVPDARRSSPDRDHARDRRKLAPRACYRRAAAEMVGTSTTTMALASRGPSAAASQRLDPGRDQLPSSASLA
jgi:hypothetical protein